jgi:hypothetical protein
VIHIASADRLLFQLQKVTQEWIGRNVPCTPDQLKNTGTRDHLARVLAPVVISKD